MTLRVAHLLVRRKGGGTETNVNRLCESVPGFFAWSLEDAGLLPLSAGNALRAAAAIRALPADVIFCYGITMHALALAAFPLGKPLVGNIRCETDFAGKKAFLPLLAGRRFRPWISNSAAALRGVRGRVIYNGIPEPPPDPPSHTGLRKPVMGILASGQPKKRHREFLAIWKDLGKPGTLLFGGNLGPELKAAAEAEGVLCPGFVEPGPFLRSLDLLLVPSSAEGLPTVLLEAMIRAVPALATPVGGVGELIRHGENGYVLPLEKWAEFLAALDVGRLSTLGAQAREDVRKDFGFEAMKAAFIEAAREAHAG